MCSFTSNLSVLLSTEPELLHIKPKFRTLKAKGTFMTFIDVLTQYKSKEMPQLIGLFSPNLVITNFMQCFLYGPIG